MMLLSMIQRYLESLEGLPFQTKLRCRYSGYCVDLGLKVIEDCACRREIIPETVLQCG